MKFIRYFYYRYIRRYDGEICQDCKKPVREVWHISNDLWKRVMGGPGGILCRRCFRDRAVGHKASLWDALKLEAE